jgi:predicted transcriptional regulator
MSDKEAVLEALRGLPDAATIDEIIEQIAILAAIRRGERAADAGQVISHEEMKQRAAAWISK